MESPVYSSTDGWNVGYDCIHVVYVWCMAWDPSAYASMHTWGSNRRRLTSWWDATPLSGSRSSRYASCLSSAVRSRHHDFVRLKAISIRASPVEFSWIPVKSLLSLPPGVKFWELSLISCSIRTLHYRASSPRIRNIHSREAYKCYYESL